MKWLGLSDEQVLRIGEATKMAANFSLEYETPEMIPVESSNLESVGYDDESQMMYVHFLAKRTWPRTLYVYFDVPLEVYEGLLAADSHGQYFNAYVRNVYQYERLE